MPNRIGLALLTLVALGVPGCVTPEEMRQVDMAQCQGYGFAAGTPDFAACLQRESLARRYPPPPYWGPDWWPGRPPGFWR